MTVLSANQFPGAEHRPLEYPGRRPNFSFVYYQGKAYEITAQGGAYEELFMVSSSGHVPVDSFLANLGNAPLHRRHAVLAVGSNGCPGRLAEKYRNQPETAIPVLVGTVTDTAVIYSRRLVGYGALPATYLRQTGAVSWLSITLLTDEQMALMDRTEKVGDNYQRITVPGDFLVEGGLKVSRLTAYLDRRILSYRDSPVYLKMFARLGPEWPVMDEREVLTVLFDEAGILQGESIEARHKRLLQDPALRQHLAQFLDSRMSGLEVSAEGRLI